MQHATGSDHRGQDGGDMRSLRIQSKFQAGELLEKVTSTCKRSCGGDGRGAEGSSRRWRKVWGWNGSPGARGRSACHPAQPGDRARRVGRGGHSFPRLQASLTHKRRLQTPCSTCGRGETRGLNSQTSRLSNPAVRTAEPSRRPDTSPVALGREHSPGPSGQPRPRPAPTGSPGPPLPEARAIEPRPFPPLPAVPFPNPPHNSQRAPSPAGSAP